MDIVLLVQIQDVVVVEDDANRFSCTICNVRVTVREVKAFASLVRQRQHLATTLEVGS